MSRNIVNDHLFTDEEVEYLKGRRRIYDIEQNAIEFGSDADDSEDDDKVELSDEVVEEVRALSDSQVKAELTKRNLPTEGTDKELKFALAEQLQREKDLKG